MQFADEVDAEDAMSRSDETQRTLESLRQLAEKHNHLHPTPFEEKICANLQCQDK